MHSALNLFVFLLYVYTAILVERAIYRIESSLYRLGLCLSLLRYIFNVSLFTLTKGTGLPENHVF